MKQTELKNAFSENHRNSGLFFMTFAEKVIEIGPTVTEKWGTDIYIDNTPFKMNLGLNLKFLAPLQHIQFRCRGQFYVLAETPPFTLTFQSTCAFPVSRYFSDMLL